MNEWRSWERGSISIYKDREYLPLCIGAVTKKEKKAIKLWVEYNGLGSVTVLYRYISTLAFISSISRSVPKMVLICVLKFMTKKTMITTTTNYELDVLPLTKKQFRRK